MEVAKAFTAGRCHLYDAHEWQRIQTLYGSLTFLQHNPDSSGSAATSRR